MSEDKPWIGWLAPTDGEAVAHFFTDAYVEPFGPTLRSRCGKYRRDRTYVAEELEAESDRCKRCEGLVEKNLLNERTNRLTP